MTDTPANGVSDHFRKNTLIVLSFLLAWTVVMIAHAFFYSVIQRDKLLAESRRLAWRTGVLPAIRGSIFRADGSCLARTVVRYKLSFSKNTAPAKRAMLHDLLKKCFPAKKGPFTELSPQDLALIQPLLRKFPEIQVLPYFERQNFCQTPAGRLRVGELKKDETAHTEYGISGYELIHDAELRGTNGRFTVMLDRSGGWIPGSLKILEAPQRGCDVYVAEFVHE